MYKALEAKQPDLWSSNLTMKTNTLKFFFNQIDMKIFFKYILYFI